jgi:hypothetical protein
VPAPGFLDPGFKDGRGLTSARSNTRAARSTMVQAVRTLCLARDSDSRAALAEGVADIHLVRWSLRVSIGFPVIGAPPQ